MSRPKKQTVDWFPHYAAHGKTMFVLESQHGNDGYAVWFKTLELLASSEGHYLCLETPSEQAFLQAKTRLDWVIICRIYDLLAELGAIDSDLWHEQRIIWSDHFTDGIAAVYVNRKVETPSRPSFYRSKPHTGVVSTSENPQRKEVEEGSRGSESELTPNQLRDPMNPWVIVGRVFCDAWPDQRGYGGKIAAVKKLYEEWHNDKTPDELTAQIKKLKAAGVTQCKPWELWAKNQQDEEEDIERMIAETQAELRRQGAIP